jgi:hypothetical protein
MDKDNMTRRTDEVRKEGSRAVAEMAVISGVLATHALKARLD